MAQRVPVVAVADAGPVDILEQARSGVLVERPDAGLLAEAVDGLLRDAARARRIGERGHERLLERFTAERMTTRLESTLETLDPARAAVAA
jgi:glycosyltransferase involved in cell wall biosynthesis